MIKTITKIGNSKGIIFDAALLELAGLKVGDKVNVTVHQGGTITLTPDVVRIDPEQAKAKAAAFIKANDELFDRLSK
jgi:antitoxin component of MazEF toxin-antitoxin module